MPRGEKPRTPKVKVRHPDARDSLKNEGSRVSDLEQRLTESLEREQATGEMLHEKNRALTEALEQQTATSEILQVISSSPTDVQPTFDAIAASARHLCEADNAFVFRFDGTFIHLAAHNNLRSEELEAVRSVFPIPPGRGSVTARAIVTRSLVHVRDRRKDSDLQYSALSTLFPNTLSVPLLRGGVPLGAITVTRTKIGLFSDRQVVLLQTFADQAVIAIENVRLFTELQEKNRALTEAHAQVTEALQQQTATSDILRVISSSPTDIEPVFVTIARSAATLCEAHDASIFRRDSDRLILVAHHGPIPFGSIGKSLPLVRGTAGGRAVLDGRTVHVADLQAERNEFPEGSEIGGRFGHRTVLCVPLMRGEIAIGCIGIRRTEVQLFTERQIALLQTFADQAVIAIENVRLFTELQASNRELTTALDTQTATSDILRVISRSQTDVQPVFDAIVASAVRLLGAYTGVLTRVEGDQLVLATLTSTDDTGDIALRAGFPQSLDSEGGHPQVIRDRAPLNVADAH